MKPMTCLKCGAVTLVDHPDETTACPACGAIYAKVLAALAQRRARVAAAQPPTWDQQPARERLAARRGGGVLPGRLLRIAYALVLIDILLPSLLPGSGWVQLALGPGSILGGGLAGLLAWLLLLARLILVVWRPVALQAVPASLPLRWLRRVGFGLMLVGALVWLLKLAAPPLAAMLLAQSGQDATGRLALQFVVAMLLGQLSGIGPLGLLMFELSRLTAFERQGLAPSPQTGAARS
jgi:hypothetical protein